MTVSFRPRTLAQIDWRARFAEPRRPPSPAMLRAFAAIERTTAPGICKGHKRLARKYLREQPVAMSPRAMRIVARWQRMQERRAALEVAA